MAERLAQALIRRETEVTALLRGLSHPVRLRVLCFLMDGERCVAELTDFCEIPQSAMSQFLARMTNEGLLKKQRRGQRVYYRVADVKLMSLLKSIKNLYC